MAKTRGGLPVVRDATIEGLKTYKLPFPPPDKREWTNADLDYTCEVHRQNLSSWQFLDAAYEGVEALIRLGLIEQHERESTQNFERRKREMFGFDYSRSIAELFNFYLHQRPVKRELGDLETDPLWIEFTRDCDFRGSRFEDYLTEIALKAAVYGHVGLMLDKPMVRVESVEDARVHGVYPYIALYTPPAILDWKHQRDEYGRPRLEYLKLKDDDGTYRLWWREKWEAWQKLEGAGGQGEKIAEGTNPLGEIPFVWLYNEKTTTVGLGRSDISGVARVDVSLIRNLSQGEEIINYAAFPMMRKPMARLGNESADDAGPTAILEFDPENPNAKPDWLAAEVSGPLAAIQDWLKSKIAEIYRASNAGGMAATEINAEAQSGVAIQAQFQLLNAKLVKKAVSLEHAEQELVRLWRIWQGIKDDGTDVIERSRKYDVENLAVDLENFLTARTIVVSARFDKEVQKTVSRRVLPTAPEDTQAEIDEEIETGRVAPTELEKIGGTEEQEPEGEGEGEEGDVDGSEELSEETIEKEE